VWLVAFAAVAVTGRSRLLLRLMTAAAGRGHAPSMRLVTVAARRVTGFDDGALLGVARSAPGHSQLRAMRQSGVAALASLVTGLRLDAGQLGRVTGLTGALIRKLAHEVVRHVAAFAIDAGVKRFVAACVLVTCAAITHARSQLRAGRVRIVTTNAGAHFAFLGVVGVLFGVTTRASLVGARHHVVSRVAVGALLVTLGMPRTQNRHVFVARTASHRLFLTELVRLVAADAGHVPSLEQRAGGHDRLRLFVTRHACLQRVGAGAVLLLVTGRAHLIRCLAAQGVGRLHVLVAVCAGSGLGRRVFVWFVTVQALTGVVNLHGRRERLRFAVTVRAIAGLMRVRCLVISKPLQAAGYRVVAETVTQRAVALQLRFEPRAGFAGGVDNTRFFLMTSRAARRRDGAELGLADGVTGATGHLLFDDMHVMPGDGARRLPTSGNVYAASRVRRLGTITARASQHRCQQEQDGRPAPTARLVTPHGAAPGRR
jgi:hypothetical protein